MSFYSSGYRYDIKSLRSWAALFGAWHLVHVKWLGSDISFPLSKNTSLEKIWCSLAKEGSRKLKPAWSFVSHGKLAKFTMKIIWKHEVQSSLFWARFFIPALGILRVNAYLLKNDNLIEIFLIHMNLIQNRGHLNKCHEVPLGSIFEKKVIMGSMIQTNGRLN